MYALFGGFYLTLGIAVLLLGTGRVEPSATFHWAFTFFLALDAWVHWFNAYGRFEHEPRAIINAIPFAVFLVLGLLRRATRT